MAEISVVLRVDGPNLDLDATISRHRLGPQLVWRRGESRRAGGTHDTNGFNLHLGDADSSRVAILLATEFLTSGHELVESVKKQLAEVTLDFGVMVGGHRPFAPSIIFQSHVIAQFAVYGIDVVVSCYPVSE